MDAIETLQANLADPSHADALLQLLDAYAADPMGGEFLLDEATRSAIVPGLAAHPTSLVYLARMDGQFIGAAVCFVGFSTFQARPLINVHDLTVRAEFRRRGVASQLLAAVADRARASGCCKITLEVREDNLSARRLYARKGFTGSQSGQQAVEISRLDSRTDKN